MQLERELTKISKHHQFFPKNLNFWGIKKKKIIINRIDGSDVANLEWYSDRQVL